MKRVFTGSLLWMLLDLGGALLLTSCEAKVNPTVVRNPQTTTPGAISAPEQERQPDTLAALDVSITGTVWKPAGDALGLAMPEAMAAHAKIEVANLSEGKFKLQILKSTAPRQSSGHPEST